MAESTFLERILAHKREEVERQKAKVPPAKLHDLSAGAPATRRFAAELRHAGRLGLIAEIKKQSPSKGLLAMDFDPMRLAQIYSANGADAISILTDLRYFGGSLQHLKTIRASQGAGLSPDARAVPLLRKDFIIDAYQVYESRAYGADALLLIVAALEAELVSELLALTREVGMEALVEVHDEAELDVAMRAGADLIGINNRDLHTFDVDVNITGRLLGALPTDARPTMVSLSGLRTADELPYLRGLGADAILVGEAIVTAADPGAKVRELSGRQASG